MESATMNCVDVKRNVQASSFSSVNTATPICEEEDDEEEDKLAFFSVVNNAVLMELFRSFRLSASMNSVSSTSSSDSLSSLLLNTCPTISCSPTEAVVSPARCASLASSLSLVLRSPCVTTKRPKSKIATLSHGASDSKGTITIGA